MAGELQTVYSGAHVVGINPVITRQPALTVVVTFDHMPDTHEKALLITTKNGRFADGIYTTASDITLPLPQSLRGIPLDISVISDFHGKRAGVVSQSITVDTRIDVELNLFEPLVIDPGVTSTITGTVKRLIDNVQRRIVAFTWDRVEGQHKVMGSTTSAPDGTYSLNCNGYSGRLGVVALDDAGVIWTASTVVNVGDLIMPTAANQTGYIYEVITAGTTGVTEPAWWTPSGGATNGTDGTATLKAIPYYQPIAHGPVFPLVTGNPPVNLASYLAMADDSDAWEFWRPDASTTAVFNGTKDGLHATVTNQGNTVAIGTTDLAAGDSDALVLPSPATSNRTSNTGAYVTFPSSAPKRNCTLTIPIKFDSIPLATGVFLTLGDDYNDREFSIEINTSGSVSASGIGAVATPGMTPHLLTLVLGTNTVTVYFDGIEVGSGGYIRSGTAAAWLINGYEGNWGSNIRIGSVAMMSTEQSSADVWEQYLRWKYGAGQYDYIEATNIGGVDVKKYQIAGEAEAVIYRRVDNGQPFKA